MDVKLAEERLKDAQLEMQEANDTLKRLELTSTDQAKTRVTDKVKIAWRRLKAAQTAFVDAHLERIGW